jgi:hypothetical protein
MLLLLLLLVVTRCCCCHCLFNNSIEKIACSGSAARNIPAIAADAGRRAARPAQADNGQH